MSHLTLSEYDLCPYSGRNVAAVKIGRINNKNYYRVPVYIRANSSKLCRTVATDWTTVNAHSAKDAANWAIENLINNRPETEVIAIGPKGGEVLRYNGWHSAIGREIFNRIPAQLTIPGFSS